MAYKDFSSGFDGSPHGAPASHHDIHLHIDGQTVQLPDAAFVKDADLSREGMNLVLHAPDGSTVIVEGYFAADPAPNLVAPDGSTLTPQLVESFTHGHPEYASNAASDVSPVGKVQEVSGHANVTHPDGTTEVVAKGTPIFEGDVIQTDAHGAVNIMFVDQTTFAVSEDARLAIDKYVYDPSTQSGTTDFSLLKGVFVFTSGLIGRDDPDHVKIDTPAGSIGIRGTVIAGNVTSGEITVVEGAIVLHDFQGHEVTLASQYETAKFNPGGNIDHMGQISASDVSAKFSSVSSVAPNLFSTIHDSVQEQNAHPAGSDSHAPDTTHGTDNGAQNNAAPDSAPVVDTAHATVPLPPVGVQNSGFGAPSAFAPAANAANLPPASGSTTGPQGPAFAPPVSAPPVSVNTPPPGTAFNSGSMPPPVQPINPEALPPVNQPPVHFFNVPPEFFAIASAGSVELWHYTFASDFKDPNPGNVLTYQLDQQTINQLNSWTADGAGASPDILGGSGYGLGLINVTGDENHGWTFDSSNGELTLFVNTGFDTTQVPANSFLQLNIGVHAVDQSGADSGSAVYNFKAYDPGQSYATSFTHNADGTVVSHTAGALIGTIVGDGDNFFLGSGNDIITVDNTITGGNTGSNNTVHLGDGTNSMIVEFDAFGNTGIGGADNDAFVLKTAQVHAFGMGGDDTFTLDFSNGPNLNTELQAATSNTIIDGNGNGFGAAGAMLRSLGIANNGSTTAGHGDTIELKGAGTLDFSQVNPNNHFYGIERIDAESSTTAANNVILRYQDVLQMTDGNHALIINLDGQDQLHLNGSQFNLANMHKVADNVSVDDAAAGQAANLKNYDVYSDGHVTLMIHDASNGAAVVSFDGTNVAV